MKTRSAMVPCSNLRKRKTLADKELNVAPSFCTSNSQLQLLSPINPALLMQYQPTEPRPQFYSCTESQVIPPVRTLKDVKLNFNLVTVKKYPFTIDALLGLP